MQRETVFYPAFGNRPDQIVGREQVIVDFLDGLSQKPGHRDRSTLVLGQRGMGKTALLLEFAARAAEEGFVTARVTANKEMLEEIVEIVQLEGARFIHDGNTKVKGFSAGALGFSLGLTFTEEVNANYGFRVKLSLLCDKLAESGKGILVLVDEAQANTDEMRTLATTYQHLVGDGKNIAIAMAGLPSAVSGILNDNILTFLNRARKVHLGPLPLGAINAYYSKVFDKLGKTIDKPLLDAAVHATQGFPYLLQLVGYYLVECSETHAQITAPMLEHAVENAKADLVENIFLTSLKPLSDVDISFLKAMAQDEGTSKIADIWRRMGVSEKYVQPYRARLIDAGIVASPRRGELEFTIPYLADYLGDRL